MTTLGQLAPGAMRFRIGMVAWGLWVGMLSFGSARAAAPSEIPRDDCWVPNGEVKAIIHTNGIVYIGGNFDYISPVSTTGGAFDLFSGLDDPGFPPVKGAIKAIVADENGGWFVGGLFTAVGSVAVTNLAHILPDNTVDPYWRPNPDKMVSALVTREGKLYVGGNFTSIGGVTRKNLAALDAASGAALTGWRADSVGLGFGGGSVNALVLGGEVLYIAGYFSSINGTAREHLGAVDAQTGTVTAWNPNIYTGGEAMTRVDALALEQNILYVGGTFRAIGGTVQNQPLRGFVASFDVTRNGTNSLTPWNPNASGPVTCLSVFCNTVYVGGTFTNIGGQPRNYIAAVDSATGQATEWNPHADAEVFVVAYSGNSIYTGGKFTRVGGETRHFLAALDSASGLATPWSPRADFGVAAVSIAGQKVVAGGSLGWGGQLRQNVAAFDVYTGQPMPWNPVVSGSTTISGSPSEGVSTMLLVSNLVYLGGPFTAVNAQPRNRAAAVDALTGSLAAWNPNSDNPVETLAAAGATIYAGGRFNAIGGTMRTNLAALDAFSGSAITSWNAGANEKVLALAAFGDLLLVGGRFTSIGNQPRNRLAVLDQSGAPLSWNPNLNDYASTFFISGNTLYFGGQFTTVEGLARNRLAALDLASYTLSAWNPNPHYAGLPSAAVNTVWEANSMIFTGGSFDRIAEQEVFNLAALSPSVPVGALAWYPQVDASVNTLATAEDTLFVGGLFQNVSGEYRPYLAVFPPVGAPTITEQPQSQIVSEHSEVVLQVVAIEDLPLAYQWHFNGATIPGATNTLLVISNAQAIDSGEYTVVVTNNNGLINSRPATLVAFKPLRILSQPVSQVTPPGSSLSLGVEVEGNPPPIYQWRLNGVNIPGAIFPTLVLTNVTPAEGGTYDVVVAHTTNAVASDPATVLVTVTNPTLALSDNFSARITFDGLTGLGSGDNATATLEPSEPHHAGHRGGKSLWLGWRAPLNGIATFSTRGSSFDTVLGIYTGTNLESLLEVANDDDRGGFTTSRASFNAVAGTEYLIAVDGFAGRSGNLVLAWDLDTSTVPFPRIIYQPQRVTVAQGQAVTFFVQVDSPTPVTYQWMTACRSIPGATNAALTVPNVQPGDVGGYWVRVTNASSHVAESEIASLEIGGQPSAFSRDKVEDLYGEEALKRTLREGAVSSASPIYVSAGTVGNQLLNNCGTTNQPGAQPPCGVIGGSSKWLRFQALSNGKLMIDTIGSTFDTVLVVYSGENLLTLKQVACDNNGAPDRIRSVVNFTAHAGSNYSVVVDGVNGAQGTVVLNYRMDTGPVVTNIMPANQTIWLGGEANLSAGVGAMQPVFCQWRHNGTNIPGATNLTWSLPIASISQAGLYSLYVSNFAGTVLTNLTTVTVALPLELTGSLAVTNGTEALRLQGPISQKYVVQASASLPATNWLGVYTNNGPAAPLEYWDLASTNHVRRFYRIVPWP